MIASPLIDNAGALWKEATTCPFLDALAAGALPPEAFHRWLAQDYLFAKGLTGFQSILIAKVPRDCQQTLIAGLGALDKEMAWFQEQGARLELNLEVGPHPLCRRYIDFLMRCAYSQPYSVSLAVLFGVEVCYLTAWSSFPPAGPYAEFIERWSSASFAAYVSALAELVDRHPHPETEKYFQSVLCREREFWQMAWEG